MTPQEVYDQLKIACESYLYGTPSKSELILIETYPSVFLAALKSKKKDVEYQFAAHKVTCQSYHNEYIQNTLSKKDYFDLLLEERQWRAKAISFLSRIETSIIEIKAKTKLCHQNSNDNNF